MTKPVIDPKAVTVDDVVAELPPHITEISPKSLDQLHTQIRAVADEVRNQKEVRQPSRGLAM